MFWWRRLKSKKRKNFVCCAQSGLTFMEVLISLLVLSIGALSTLQIINVSMNTHYRATQDVIASNLATALMSEIKAKKFEESLGDATFGIESPEYRFDPSPSVSWDDVDDYHLFSEPVPMTIGGLYMTGAGSNSSAPNYQGFVRSVVVDWYDVTTGSVVVGTPTSCKQINVTVRGPAVGEYSILGHKSAPAGP